MKVTLVVTLDINAEESLRNAATAAAQAAVIHRLGNDPRVEVLTPSKDFVKWLRKEVA
jgi:hypothetical protein